MYVPCTNVVQCAGATSAMRLATLHVTAVYAVAMLALAAKVAVVATEAPVAVVGAAAGEGSDFCCRTLTLSTYAPGAWSLVTCACSPLYLVHVAGHLGMLLYCLLALPCEPSVKQTTLHFWKVYQLQAI